MTTPFITIFLTKLFFLPKIEVFDLIWTINITIEPMYSPPRFFGMDE